VQTLFDTSFRAHSNVPPKNHVERHVASTTYHVQIQRAKWTSFGEGEFLPPWSFIQLMLVSTPMECWYDGTGKRGASARLGEISFIPSGKTLNCRWRPHNQRALSCMFDLKRLAERAGADWDWAKMENPEAALDIKNPYIGMALRRIAEELLSPSFASDAQIECSLMFITHELHRQFTKSRSRTSVERGKLSAWQLTVVREKLSADLGEGLSIHDIAEACGCGTRQLSKLYRNTAGETLRARIAQSRLERAKILLLNRDMQIKQAASLTGFRTLSAFSAAFRQATTLTPSEFQRVSGVPC
jgi:AraC family transcriptional regulator